MSVSFRKFNLFWKKEKWISLVFFILIVIQGACVWKESGQTEILWDTWGVPHIFAENTEGVFYGFGWAQMKSHGNLICRLYGEARGRAAEYWGESFLSADRIIHTLGIPKFALQWYRAQRKTFRKYIDSFVAGMNAYAESHPDKIADDFKKILPFAGQDVMAHTLRVLLFGFVGGSALSGAQQWQMLGSNSWAIAPSRSASGHAMLLINPHLSWSGFFLWYEAQLITKNLDAYGATLVGMPTLAIGFNDYLGWTHTVNTFDGVDLYELKLTENGYLFDGEERSFETANTVFKVKQKDGNLREERLTVKLSVHGPVLAEKNGKALAFRIVSLDQPYLWEQYWDMLYASNLVEFEKAVKRLQIPMFNIVYADRDGHIYYLFNGRVPKRKEGDWRYWRGIVPGDSSDTLWSETHPYEDLPRVVDPPNGWVQNANDPPWTSTLPKVLNPESFPPYMSPRMLPLRPQRSIGMLKEDKSITFEELVAYKLSTRMELADRILDDLIPAVMERGSPLVRQAFDVLKKWDRRADADSRGAYLFSTWIQKIGPNLFAVPWSEEAPLTTPDGLADPEAAVKALEKAAEQVIDLFGALDVPWGDVFRLRLAGKDLPGNGGPGSLGIFRVVGYVPDEDDRYRAVGGDSFVAAVEFSNPIRARVLLSYGNATQPDSPHVGDQLELFSQKKLRPVWRSREEIEAHLENKEMFKIP
ncbi:MAG: acylase [Candidatus Aminicenantes bacterium]|jgi:acyl-homoserine-lactone acylase